MIRKHKGANLLGLSIGFIRDPVSFVMDMSKEWGDFYRLNLPGYRFYVVSRPDLVRHILVTNQEKYIKGRVYWKALSLVTGQGIATSEGPGWVNRRRMMQPYLTKSQIQSYIPRIIEMTGRSVQSILPADKITVEIDIMQVSQRIVASMNQEILLGFSKPGSDTELNELMSHCKDYVMYRARFPWDNRLIELGRRHKRFRKELSAFDRIVYEHIDTCRQHESKGDNLISGLISRKDNNGTPLYSDTEIRDEFITLLGGASENTASCFAWTIYLLCMNPVKFERLAAEIDKIPGINRQLSVEDLERLTYTRQVLKESLRLYPPGYAIIREAVEEDIIEGEKIPPGSTMYIASTVLHRHPGFWLDPDSFIPERFELNEENNHPDYTYIPFGAGKHACVGAEFALTMLTIMLHQFIRLYTFSWDGKENVRPFPGMVQYPEGGGSLRILKRPDRPQSW